MLDLLHNSIDALEESGEINIKTTNTEKAICISIKDNGHGIAEEDLQRILDPFYTTKEPGKGTGLGLAITNSIINEHKGRLEIKSEKDVYTEVLITLPIKHYNGEKNTTTLRRRKTVMTA